MNPDGGRFCRRAKHPSVHHPGDETGVRTEIGTPNAASKLMGTIAVFILGIWVLLALMFCLALGLTALKPVPNPFASPDRVQSRATSAATAGKEAPAPWETSP